MAACVTTGPQDRDTEEDAGVYPMTPGNRPSEGGTAYHAMTESYPLKKALPGLAGIASLGSIIGVWSVQSSYGHTQTTRVGMSRLVR